MKNNNNNLVKLLIENFADINHRGSRNHLLTPSMVCCMHNSTDILKLLLEFKADMSLVNNDGNTTFIYSCTFQKNGSLKLLLKHRNEFTNEETGIDINAVNNFGWSGLMHACSNRLTLSSIKLLLSSNADASIVNNEGDTALIYCLYHIEAMKLLLQYRDESIDGAGIDINAKDKNGWTILTLACSEGYNQTVDLLLSANADASIPNKVGGKTALIICCARNQIESLKSLLKYRDESINGDNDNIDINAVGDNGRTGLMEACSAGYTNIVNLLLSSKADVNISDKNGNNAYSLSKTALVQEIIETYTSAEQYILK
jgi:ankyrin repeat protein